MRWVIIIAVLLPLQIFAQETAGISIEEQLEDIAENNEDAEITDDSWMQQMVFFKKHPLDLNQAPEAALATLQLLSPVQIAQLLQYRRALGRLISIYELQAVPGWDVALIRKILPYVTVSNAAPLYNTLLSRFGKGDQSLLLRFSTLLQKPKGYTIKDSSKSHYAGNPARALIRYAYRYKNLLQYGLTASKDAGEAFFGKHEKTGFDFYSIHFFARNTGIIRSLALGDYTLNLGQGLICWQGLAVGTGAEATNIKRQSAILRPYNSAGDYFFNRGAAVTVGKRQWQATGFISRKQLDANIEYNDERETETATAIHTSGYHRTASETEDRGTLSMLMYGGNLSYSTATRHIGFSAIRYSFGKPIAKEKLPYNLYALSGKKWGNYSIDYSFSFRNAHFFGETATDVNRHFATINGVIIGVDAKADITLLYRSVSPMYQSFYGNANTVNTMPTNENGLYIGTALRLSSALRIDLSADIFHFSWLKYRIDAPSGGSSYVIQCSYKPSKLTEMHTRYRVQHKPVNQTTDNNPLNEVISFSNQSWRTQINSQLGKRFSIRQRFEIVWYATENKPPEKGFLTSFDLFFKPASGRFTTNIRVQYFESDSYNARLYAYENDVLYYYAIPAFYDKGVRYYVNLKYALGRSVSVWLKWAETLYTGKNTIGSGLDEIEGNRRSEIRLLATIDI